MGLFSRVIKGADQQTGERAEDSTYHGSNSRWQVAQATGNLRRWNEKPKPAPWSRETRRPR